MSKSLIYAVNDSLQTVADGAVINLGRAIHRYGCNCDLNGNAITVDGVGYYSVTASVTAVPSAAGTVTVTAYRNGTPIAGATASTTVAAADTSVALPVIGTAREYCACNDVGNITFVLSGVESDVSNIAVRVVKE